MLANSSLSFCLPKLFTLFCSKYETNQSQEIYQENPMKLIHFNLLSCLAIVIITNNIIV